MPDLIKIKIDKARLFQGKTGAKYLVFLFALDAVLAWYLVLVLALWPVIVAAVKFITSATWGEAQRYTWHRWNEIRLTWRHDYRPTSN